MKMTDLYKDPLIYPITCISDRKPIEWIESFIKDKKPEYNSNFKKQVRELTITCQYNYNTVYRLCSIFGIKKAKEILNTCHDVLIQDLLIMFIDFPESMNIREEAAAMATLRSVDQKLPELFERLLESSEYNSETLYRVFMSHGCESKEIVEYAIENQLMPFQLLAYSQKKLDESAEAAFKRIKEFKNSMSKEEKLPRKLRAGWKKYE